MTVSSDVLIDATVTAYKAAYLPRTATRYMLRSGLRPAVLSLVPLALGSFASRIIEVGKTQTGMLEVHYAD
jgi:hypothetical protein